MGNHSRRRYVRRRETRSVLMHDFTHRAVESAARIESAGPQYLQVALSLPSGTQWGVEPSQTAR
jgi:hypothetical protein